MPMSRDKIRELTVNDLGEPRPEEELRKMLKKIQRLHNRLYALGASAGAQSITAQAVHALRWAVGAEEVFNLQPPAVNELMKYGLVKPCPHSSKDYEFVIGLLYKEKRSK